MSKVLFFINNPANLDDFRHRLAAENIETTVADYTDLELILDTDKSSIKLASTGADLADFDLIMNISTPAHNLMHIFSSIACYCRKKSIKMIDNSFTNTSGKLFEMWRLWEKDLSVPKTAYGNLNHLSRCLIEFGGTGILKITHGAKGRENYLVHSTEELAAILAGKNPYDYILQNFIPNNGDYRIVTFDFKPKLGIYRQASGTDHRNNTSLGAQASIVEPDSEVASLAANAAEALDIRFAGVDIITDKNTGANYVLEINRTPQFTTGSFLDEKYATLLSYLRSLNI